MPLETSLAADELLAYYRLVIGREFPDAQHTASEIDRVVVRALERIEHSFVHIALAGYRNAAGNARFSHLHGDQTAAFYYFAANSAWQEFEDETLASRFFLLNKRHNALVCMYDTQLPKVFVLIHTVGTVLGKADYGNFLAVYQNVTVGADAGRRPQLGARAVLYGGSMILAGTTLGDDVTVSAGTTLIDATIPANSVVAGSSRDCVVRRRKRDFAKQYWVEPHDTLR